MRYSSGFNFHFGLFERNKAQGQSVVSQQKKVVRKTGENKAITPEDSFEICADNTETQLPAATNTMILHQILSQEGKVLKPAVRLYQPEKSNNSLTGQLAKIPPKEEKEPYNINVIIGCILMIVVIGIVIGSLALGGFNFFVLALLVLLSSILMYIIGLIDILRGTERGKAMAIIGLIFGSFLLVAGFLALIASSIVQ